MKESQISDAFCAYLYKNGLMFVRARTDQKSTIALGWPDITICHCGRCLLVELKTLKGKTSFAQDRVIENLRANGNRVIIARTVEEAVSAVQTWLGVENAVLEPMAKPEEPSNLWIGTLFGVDYVFRGEFSAGSTAEKVRRATPEDIRNLLKQ